MENPQLAPFRPASLTVGLYRLSAAKIDVRVQRELLGVLHSEYPSLEQVPGGIEFSDKYKGKSLTVDLAKVELEDLDPDSYVVAIDHMIPILEKVLRSLTFPPPYRVRVEATGTIQGLGSDPLESLRKRFGPEPGWFADVPGHAGPGVRYALEAPDGSIRDYKIEPWFAKPGHFYVSATAFSPPTGESTLVGALDFARAEAERTRVLGDRIATDIVRGSE